VDHKTEILTFESYKRTRSFVRSKG